MHLETPREMNRPQGTPPHTPTIGVSVLAACTSNQQPLQLRESLPRHLSLLTSLLSSPREWSGTDVGTPQQEERGPRSRAHLLDVLQAHAHLLVLLDFGHPTHVQTRLAPTTHSTRKGITVKAPTPEERKKQEEKITTKTRIGQAPVDRMNRRKSSTQGLLAARPSLSPRPFPSPDFEPNRTFPTFIDRRIQIPTLQPVRTLLMSRDLGVDAISRHRRQKVTPRDIGEILRSILVIIKLTPTTMKVTIQIVRFLEARIVRITLNSLKVLARGMCSVLLFVSLLISPLVLLMLPLKFSIPFADQLACREDPSEGTTEKSQTRFGETNGLHKKFSADDWRAHLDNFDFLGASAKRMYSSRASNSPVSGSKPRSRNSLHTDSTDSVPSSKSPGPNMFGSGLGDQPQPPPSDPQQSQAPSPFPFAQAKFSADEWSKQLHDLQWNPPEPETTRKSANNTPPTPRSRKQSRAGAKVRSVPKPASVASELDESTKTVNDDEPASMPAQPAPPEAEAMDIDDELPSPPVNTTPESPTKNGDYPNLSSNVTQEAQAPEPAPPQPPQQTQPPAQHPAQNGVPKEEARAPLFNLDNLRNTAPFTNTTSGGIENLGDVHDTLPFESRAKQQTTTERDIRPRELNLPNPPKRPWAPKLVSMGPNTQVLPIDKWRHYTSAMSAYIYEWNQFNRRMLLHFNTRQEAIETGLSPNWMSAVGDTTRLKLNGDDDDSNDQEPSESDLDEYLVPGSKKGGFSAYVRGIEEDIQVRKHWDVACEMHRECILDLGRLREWIRNGGKLVSFSTV